MAATPSAARRLRALSAALAPPRATEHSRSELRAARTAQQAVEATEALSHEEQLMEDFYQLDLEGYLVIGDVLSEGEVAQLNGILDERGIEAGVPVRVNGASVLPVLPAASHRPTA